MTLVAGWDATHANLGHVPAGQGAGYTTGTPDIVWTAADWAAHPGAVRICQNAGATDHTADVLDVEAGAATNAEAAAWYRAALLAYEAGTRPGQRWPAIYTSLSNVTPLVNALIAGGVTSGPRLWIAHWQIGTSGGQATVTDTGPFPVIGCQYGDAGAYDVDYWDAGWLQAVAHAPVPAGDVQVPDVVGGSGNAALLELAAAGLTGMVHTDHLVVSQTPGPGAVVAKGSNVNLGV